MTLAQLQGWARWHAASGRMRLRDLVTAIQAAMTGDAATIDRVFAAGPREPSPDETAAQEAETLAAFGVQGG